MGVLPDMISLFICGGYLPETSTSIQWHRDHSHFIGKAVMLNLGEAIYREKPERGSDHIIKYKLTDGLVVLIDTKLLHSAEQISAKRYNFTFRRIKPQYLP